MTATHAYELELGRALLSALNFRLKNMHPRLVAEKLGAQGIYVWDGNYYALNVTERLGVEKAAAWSASVQCITTHTKKWND